MYLRKTRDKMTSINPRRRIEPHYSATSNEETHAELDRTDHTVSEVIKWK